MMWFVVLFGSLLLRFFFQNMQFLLPILDFCNTHAWLRLAAVKKSWHEVVWPVLVSTVMQSHVSVQKLFQSQCYSKPNPRRVQRLVQCHTRGGLMGNALAEDICLLQCFLSRLRSVHSEDRRRLLFGDIIQYIRHGLADDMRGLHARTIFALYEQFLPEYQIRLLGSYLFELDEDFTDAVANFRQTWISDGTCREITLWHFLSLMQKCKRHFDFSLIRDQLSDHPTLLSGSFFHREVLRIRQSSCARLRRDQRELDLYGEWSISNENDFASRTRSLVEAFKAPRNLKRLPWRSLVAISGARLECSKAFLGGTLC